MMKLRAVMAALMMVVTPVAAQQTTPIVLGTATPGFDARYARVQDTPLLDFINEVQRRRAGAQLSAAAALHCGLHDFPRRDRAGDPAS